MTVLHEEAVSSVALSVGLELTRTLDSDELPLYQLVDRQTLLPIYPGGRAAGAALGDLADWLACPWE